eukprot:NODE_55_length_29507_cov_0.809712.p22 type:complete len:126 gc:universal NODE_55_length_29507_cov_0.809712:2064-1687(-)
MRNPFVKNYCNRFSINKTGNLVEYGQGPIHVYAFPNQVCALFLDSNLCNTFKIDPSIEKAFKLKSKKFPVKSSDKLGEISFRSGESLNLFAIAGNLIELKNLVVAGNEWDDYLALITSKKELSLY